MMALRNFSVSTGLEWEAKEGKESSTLEHVLLAIELCGNMIVLFAQGTKKNLEV